MALEFNLIGIVNPAFTTARPEPQGSLIGRNEMVLLRNGLSGGGVGRLDLDADGALGHHCAFHLHGQADFTRLILSDVDREPAIGAALGAEDVQVGAR